MAVKVAKFEIKRVCDNDTQWSDFVKTLYNLQYELRTVKNRTSTIIKQFHDWEKDFNNEHGKWPEKDDVVKKYGYSVVSSFAYCELVKSVNTIGNSSNMTTSISDLCNRSTKMKKQLFAGEISYPSFKNQQPIDLHNNSVNLLKENNKYMVTLSLLSNYGKKQINRKSGQYTVEIISGKDDNHSKSVLEKIIQGEYGLGACKIEKHPTKNKWMLAVCYKFDAEKIKPSGKNVLGVDLGIAIFAHMSIYNTEINNYEFAKGNVIEGGEIERYRNGVEKRRLSMLKQSKYCGDGRKGHGRKTLLKPTEILSEKVSNFRQTYNHKYSKYIVDFAKKNNCYKIVFEDLSGVGESSPFLKKWSYYELQQFVAYKAKEVGIIVEFIDPQYTSQRCSHCGVIDSESRPTQKKFVCTTCGKKFNADENASKNIALPEIVEIIKEQCKVQNLNYRGRDCN